MQHLTARSDAKHSKQQRLLKAAYVLSEPGGPSKAFVRWQGWVAYRVQALPASCCLGDLQHSICLEGVSVEQSF